MGNPTLGDAAIAVVRRNTEEVQGKGDWTVFEEIWSDEFVDHTPQPGMSADKAGVKQLYSGLRAALPDLDPEIHWQITSDNMVTTFKTYHGTHRGKFLGIEPTGKKVSFESVDVMRIEDGKIVAHWGVGNLLGLVVQMGGLAAPSV